MITVRLVADGSVSWERNRVGRSGWIDHAEALDTTEDRSIRSLRWTLIVDGLSRFCNRNPACSDLGKRNVKNLTVTAHSGPGKTKRTLRCRTGKARFSELKGTPYLDARLPSAKVDSVLEHIAEGCGLRQTGRLVCVARATVARSSQLAGNDAHDDKVGLSPPNDRDSVR